MHFFCGTAEGVARALDGLCWRDSAGGPGDADAVAVEGTKGALGVASAVAGSAEGAPEGTLVAGNASVTCADAEARAESSRAADTASAVIAPSGIVPVKCRAPLRSEMPAAAPTSRSTPAPAAAAIASVLELAAVVEGPTLTAGPVADTGAAGLISTGSEIDWGAAEVPRVLAIWSTRVDDRVEPNGAIAAAKPERS